MPVEIRELIVRARVEPGGDRAEPSRSGTGRSRRSERDLVRSAAHEVLRLIEEKRER